MKGRGKGQRSQSRGGRAQTPGARKRQGSASSNGSGASVGRCLSWAKTGKCRFGDKCKFTHESIADEKSCVAMGSFASVDGFTALPCLSGGGVTHSDHKCMSWHESSVACSVISTGREWVADTGSGNDLLGRNVASHEEMESVSSLSKPKRLRTANGGIAVDSKLSCDVECLNIRVEPLLLAECPPVLSIGKRIEEGFAFHWTQEQCILVCPNGCETQLEVRGRVPMIVDREIAMPADEAANDEPSTTGAREHVSVQDNAPDNGVDEDMEEGGGSENRKAFLRKGRTSAFSKTRLHCLIHYPKNENCECCQKSRMLAQQARRVADAEDHRVVSEKFGDIIHFDHVHVRHEMLGMG
eukprot:339333-Amphidinium_carterae.2